MISPGTYNATAYQGANYDLNLTWKIGGTAVDLSTYSAAMQVREAPSSTSTILSLTNGSGIALGGTAGTIDVSIPSATMGSADAGNYVYDLELTSGTVVTRLLQGTFQIVAEVTR